MKKKGGYPISMQSICKREYW